MIKYLVIYLLWLCALFTVGQILSLFFIADRKSGLLHTLLRNIFLGYIVVILFQSIWSTQFKTINVVLLLVLIIGWIDYKLFRPVVAPVKEAEKLPVRYIVVILCSCLLFFLYNWYSIGDVNSYLKFSYGHSDYVLYGKIAESLVTDGNENGFNILNAFDSYYNNPEPYHFFDLWGAALVGNVFDINKYVSLIVIIYPTFYFLAFIGLLSLLKKVNYVSCLIILLTPLIGGIYIDIVPGDSFYNSLSNISLNLLSPGIYKLSYFYVFFISAFILYKENKFVLSVLCLSCLVVANIIALPSVLMGVMVLIMIGHYTAVVDSIIVVRTAIYCCILFSAIVVFYTMHQRNSAGLAGVEISDPGSLVAEIFQKNNFRTQINIVVGGLLSLVIVYFPFGLLAVANRSLLRRNWTLACVFLSLIMASLSGWALLYQELNSFQIFSNTAIPVCNVCIGIAIVGVINESVSRSFSSMRMYVSVVSLAILAVYNFSQNVSVIKNYSHTLHSNSYLKKVDTLLPSNSIVASIKGSKDMQSIFLKYNAVYPLGDFLFLFNKNIHSVNIGDLATGIDLKSPLDSSRSVKAIRDGVFYRYSLRTENQGITSQALMRQFVIDFKISYLLVSRNAEIPDSLVKCISVIIEDSVSGERFITLDTAKL